MLMDQQYHKDKAITICYMRWTTSNIQTQQTFETIPKTLRALPSISHLLLLVDAVRCVTAPVEKNMFPEKQSPRSSEGMPV